LRENGSELGPYQQRDSSREQQASGENAQHSSDEWIAFALQESQIDHFLRSSGKFQSAKNHRE
jgi:hypothetical protein